jgi:hypothetical protein
VLARIARRVLNSTALRLGRAEAWGQMPLMARYFDRAWYLAAYPDVAAAGADPFRHYLRRGAAEGRDPGPLFSTRWYLAMHPDVAAAGINPLVHYVRWGAAEGRRVFPSSASAALARSRPSDEAVAAVEAVMRAYAAVEPDFADLLGRSIAGLPVTVDPDDALARAWRALYLSLESAPRRMVFVAALDHWGPSEAAAMRALRAAHAIDDPNATLLVVTDQPEVAIGDRLPHGTAWRSLSHLGAALDPGERVLLVTALVHSLQPDAVLIIESRAAWEACARHGHALRQLSDIFAMLVPSGDGPDAEGRHDVTLRYFRQCLPYLTGVYAEDAASLAGLAERHGLPARERRRLRALPAASTHAMRRTGPRGRPGVSDGEWRAVDVWSADAYLQALATAPGFLATATPPSARSR